MKEKRRENRPLPTRFRRWGDRVRAAVIIALWIVAILVMLYLRGWL